MSSQLFVTIYALYIYPSAHKKLRRNLFVNFSVVKEKYLNFKEKVESNNVKKNLQYKIILIFGLIKGLKHFFVENLNFFLQQASGPLSRRQMFSILLLDFKK